MKITLNKRYLALPVSYNAREKRVLFYQGERLVFDLTARLDNLSPDTCFYVDMGRFFGEELTVATDPVMDIRISQTNSPELCDLYREKYRPAAHFSAAQGWINDPNGLIHYKGVYHMFFQHNPAGRDWGNMHWGHAVSTDLMHWEEVDIALFPDETGSMFSGSGIEDIHNLTGLKETEHNPILLFYTAAGGKSALSKGKKFTQCMAYSTDGGQTFRKYSGNPLIRETVEGNRDPKVVYNPEAGCYYLALFLKGNRYALYVSKDLINWSWRQELTLQEDGECPDLYPLTLEGEREPYWVFTGASDRYLVGRFDEEGLFQPVQPAMRLHYGTNSYAAQTFSGAPDGRIIRLAWNTARIPGTPFNCAMCTPVEMKLRTVQDEIRLCALPVPEIEGLYANHWETGEKIIRKGDPMLCPLAGKAQDIRISLTFGGGSPFRLSLLGIDFDVHPLDNCLKHKNITMPLFSEKGEIRLRIITDTNGVEVFANRGEAFLCVGHIADYNLDKLIISSKENDITVHKIEIDTLQNIWNNKKGG
ncbi:MAG: glycoside hydrolase family 32 protein [Clostridiales bacterium]|nr:glycoside hydrolase family 32 protein [Clostridiales bacterium]